MTLIIGHRGASAKFVENTLEAFAGARDLGADWVELDVQQTVDGQLAVFHDIQLSDGRRVADTAFGDLPDYVPVSYTHLRAHETREELVCRRLLEK